MADFLLAQLDFIYFFYGFAFFILGAACFAIAPGRSEALAWSILGAFAFLHGVCEWLDLAALVAGDQPSFGVVRVALNTASFMLLLEFGRLEGERFGLRVPGRWIYAPLGLAVAIGAVLGGSFTGSAIARYLICLPAALLASWGFFMQARGFSGRLRLKAILGGVAFLFYSVAAGLIPPAAPFWPANVINQDWFVHATGVPIQLVRGVLALTLAYGIWAMWGRLVVSEMASEPYTVHANRQYLAALAALAAILVGGWTLTAFFGDNYRRHIENEGRGCVELLSSRIGADAAALDGMARALAAYPSIAALLTGGSVAGGPGARAAQDTLDMIVEASGAEGGALYDRAGALVAASRRRPAHAAAPIQDDPGLLHGGRAFAFVAADRSSHYFASAPIRSGDGVVGAAVLERSLAPMGAEFGALARPSMLIDANGVVMLANRPSLLLQTLWPLPPARAAALRARYGALNPRPMMAHEVADGAWTTVDGRRAYVRRRPVAQGPWSVVMITPPIGIIVSRVLGIFITLLVALLVLIYFIGREHSVRDHLQMSRRLNALRRARVRARAAAKP